MIINIQNILEATEFNENATYAISGKTLNEIIKLVATKHEPLEIQSAIDWFYNERKGEIK
ncbi:MAG: hypothetical protein PHX08_20275 [Lachnospiraceae bacterium]|nr:hypothetical protein [Lachnospiraceae bacterium]